MLSCPTNSQLRGMNRARIVLPCSAEVLPRQPLRRLLRRRRSLVTLLVTLSLLLLISVTFTGPHFTNQPRVDSDHFIKFNKLLTKKQTEIRLYRKPSIPVFNPPHQSQNTTDNYFIIQHQHPLFPNNNKPHNDRILDQIHHMSHVSNKISHRTEIIKKIVLTNDFEKDLEGREVFEYCPVHACAVTRDWTQAESADAVMFKEIRSPPSFVKPRHQIWILYLLESPVHTPYFHGVENKINWTASYRHDSTLVTPYEKYVITSNKTTNNINMDLLRKVPRIAWFVSNCKTPNRRLEFAEKLGEFYPVDIYGKCGRFQCPKSNQEHCFQLLNTNYRYYLSFENSNCREYVTEKFFKNGLQNDIVPIVMGAPREDYEKLAPRHSFIHVDDFPSVSNLADYLYFLDQHPQLYLSYLQWKTRPGAFINTLFWCRLCSMLHDNTLPWMYYTDVNKWFNQPRTCVRHRW